jgi:hypothetical protein
MKLPAEVIAIRNRYVSRFPVPQGPPGEAFEEQARQWSIRLAEQVAFEQGPLWGMKRADAGRPISKDTIAFYADETIRIWDLLIGTGTGSPRLLADPDSEDLVGQLFVKVNATDHLGNAPVPQPTPSPAPAPLDLTPITDALKALASTQESVIDSVVLNGTVGGERHGIVVKAVQAVRDAVDAQTVAIDALTAALKKPRGLRIYGRTLGQLDGVD